MDIVDEILAHHGVKGMKWGVRQDSGHEGQRTKTKKIAKLDKRFDRGAGTVHTMIKIRNASVDASNRDLDRLNNKPEYKNKDFTRDSPLRRKYVAEIQKFYIDNLEAAAKSMGTNASGTKRYGIIEHDNGRWDVIVKDVKHTDTSDEVEFTLMISYDDLGHIVKIDSPDMSQGDQFLDLFLAHHGVKGMRWGVRRVSSSRSGPTEVVLRSRGGTKIRTSGGKGHPPSEEALRTATLKQRAKKSSVKSLSNKELQDAIQRMNLERQYKTLSGKNPAKDFLAKLLAEAGKREASSVFNTQVEKVLSKK